MPPEGADVLDLTLTGDSPDRLVCSLPGLLYLTDGIPPRDGLADLGSTPRVRVFFLVPIDL